jgi:hypothetical protein
MGRINVKVVPASSKDAIVGWLGGSLKVKVKAPPEKGKANAAVIDLLANQLGIAKDAIEIISGHASSSKVLLIHGLGDSQIMDALP